MIRVLRLHQLNNDYLKNTRFYNAFQLIFINKIDAGENIPDSFLLCIVLITTGVLVCPQTKHIFPRQFHEVIFHTFFICASNSFQSSRVQLPQINATGVKAT